MAEKLIFYLTQSLLKFEDAIFSHILRKLQPGLAFATINIEKDKPKFINIKDFLNEGFFWATPKHRRSIEKRLSRKFGWPKYNWKPLVPKTNLIMCKSCGNFHESYTICGHCYKKIKEESKFVIESIDNFNFDPISKEITVLYIGDKDLTSYKLFKGQDKIVESSKIKSTWFHKNLLELTTQKISSTKEIKPTEDLT